MCRSIGICIVTLAVVVRPVVAEAQLVARSWTTDQGLPQNVVRAVHQTRDGYIWVVTMDGLARFDGVRFTLLNRGNTPGILSNRFTAMYESADGDLWFASEEGLTRFHDGTFTSYTPRDGLPQLPVFGITGDREGRIWALANGQIVRWDAGRFSPDQGEAHGVRFARSVWRSDVFFGVQDDIIYKFSGGNLEQRALPAALKPRPFDNIAEDDAGTLWAGFTTGEVVAAGDTGTRAFPAADVIRGLEGSENGPQIDYVGRDGRRWRMRLDHELSRTVTISEAGRPTQLLFREADDDREGNVWVGTKK